MTWLKQRPAADLRGDRAAVADRGGARHPRAPPDRRRADAAPWPAGPGARPRDRSRHVTSLSLTTNGFLLKKLAKPLAEAGLTRINVSLDTLQHDKFHQITRRPALTQVLEGLAELEKHPSIRPIKVNARRDARLQRGRDRRACPVGAEDRLRGALDRVHAARRRRQLGARARPDRRRDQGDHRARLHAAGADRGRGLARRRSGSASPTALARSGSSTRSASRSAPPATASA